MGDTPEPLDPRELTQIGIVCDRCGLSRYTMHRELLSQPDLFGLYFDDTNMRWRCVDRQCAARIRVALI